MFSLLLAALLLVTPTPPATQAPYPDVIYQHPGETTCVGKAQVDENASWWFSQRFHYRRAASYSEAAARQLMRCLTEHANGVQRIDPAHDLVWAGQWAYAAGDLRHACDLELEGRRNILMAVRASGNHTLDSDGRAQVRRDLELTQTSLAGKWGAFDGPNHTTIAHWHGDPPCPSR